MYGENGDDVMRGGDGNDFMRGGADDDNLFGDDGADNMGGGDSADYLTGGAGRDRLSGGEGDDSFLFRAGSGIDVIGDFSSSDDKIGIDNSRVDDFDDLLIRNNAAGDAVVSWSDGSGSAAQITLVGVGRGQLSSEDFFFDF
jgi:Ca2+-binding RTX toxin-like protein